MDKPWDFYGLGKNTFKKEKEIFESRVKKQQFIQENVFEELVKVAMHPKRIVKYLNMGYSIDDLDNLL
jgi:hypothetical protein|uniref:Uncharacterized protein n=1 Tax=viral metagenome TaxID=1070528 RepID=A0A6C0ILL3_9ZZZZ